MYMLFRHQMSGLAASFPSLWRYVFFLKVPSSTLLARKGDPYAAVDKENATRIHYFQTIHGSNRPWANYNVGICEQVALIGPSRQMRSG